MRTSRKILIVFAFLAMAGLCWLLFFADSGEGPCYKGRHLSHWVYVLGTDIETAEAEKAVHVVGTNAYPYIIKWACNDEDPGHHQLPTLLRSYISRHFSVDIQPTWEIQMEGARRAFSLLGADKIPAPVLMELEALLAKPGATNTASRAALVLADLGCVGAPALVRAITNSSHPGRFAAFQQVAIDVRYNNSKQFADCSHTFVIPLLSCLSDPDPVIASFSASALGEIPAHKDTVVPALVAAMNGKHPQVFRSCREALEKLAPQVLTNAPVQ